MDTQLYLRVRGRVMGPYDQERLQTLVRRGQLSRMHEVSSDGTHWVQAATYPDLFVSIPVKLVAPEMTSVGPSAARLTISNPVADESPAAVPAAPPLRSGRRWYYSHDGQESGPVDESALNQMLNAGQLGPDTLVWTDTMPQWKSAAQVPGLMSGVATPTPAPFASEKSRSSGAVPDDLCKAALASRPWAIFLAIVAFVYAGLALLLGFWLLFQGADKGVPLLVAMGLFYMIGGVINVVGGILLTNYANRLAGLVYGRSARVMEIALNRLKVFWMYVSIVLIVSLAFFAFFAIWIIAIWSTLPRWLG